MKFAVAMPFVYKPYADRCLASMSPYFRRSVIPIDNRENNRGIAASWNIAVREVLDEKLDWMIGLSAAVRFGAPGGDDFVELMRASSDCWALEGGRRKPPLKGDEDANLAWHLIAFPRRTLEVVGQFDENFWPRDFEDLDYSYRIQLAAKADHPLRQRIWPLASVEATAESIHHSITLAGVEGDGRDSARYYERKWGGPTNEEQFGTPFNTSWPITWWPRAGHPLARRHGGWQ